MRLPGCLPHWRCHLPAGARPSPPPRRPVHLWGLGGGAGRCCPHRRRLSGWVCPAPSREESWERVCLGDPGPKAPAEADMPSAWVKLVNCVCVREKLWLSEQSPDLDEFVGMEKAEVYFWKGLMPGSPDCGLPFRPWRNLRDRHGSFL